VEKAGGEKAVAKQAEQHKSSSQAAKQEDDGDGAATVEHDDDDDDDGPPPLESGDAAPAAAASAKARTESTGTRSRRANVDNRAEEDDPPLPGASDDEVNRYVVRQHQKSKQAGLDELTDEEARRRAADEDYADRIEKQAPKEPAEQSDDQELNMYRGIYRLIKEFAAQPFYGDFFGWYGRQTRAHKSNFLKLTCPYIVERNNGTTDNTGADLSAMVYSCPEVTVENLCGDDGTKVRRLIDMIAMSDSAEDFLDHCIVQISDASKMSNPRGRFLAHQLRTQLPGFVFDVSTGAPFRLNEKVLKSDPSKLPKEQAAAMQKMIELVQAGALVPGGLWFMGKMRALSLVQMAAGWLTEWTQDNHADHRLANAIFPLMPK
jgi:hypothetical protein